MANITKVPNGPLIKKKGPFKGSTLKAGGVVKKAQNGTSQYSDPKPLFFKIRPIEAAVIPFPRPLITPPVTMIYFMSFF